jgi:hypothetical protein
MDANVLLTTGSNEERHENNVAPFFVTRNAKGQIMRPLKPKSTLYVKFPIFGQRGVNYRISLD